MGRSARSSSRQQGFLDIIIFEFYIKFWKKIISVSYRIELQQFEMGIPLALIDADAL